jgi:hypothetical protein
MSFAKLSTYALAATFVVTSTLVFAEEEEEAPPTVLEEAELFIELNDTDGDFGIHGFADGDEWKKLEIKSPSMRKLLKMDVKSTRKDQGLTELFFESAEPCFREGDECDDPFDTDVFFDRFPEGLYQIKAKTLEGYKLENEVYLSHVIPAAPVATANGTSDPLGACTCDEEDLEEDEECPDLPTVSAPVTLSWAAVDQSHKAKWGTDDDTDNADGKIGLGITGATEVRYYEVVVEIDETDFKATAIVPPTTDSWEVPEAFLDFGDEIKYEVLVRINNGHGNPGNKSAMESCFEVE